jgi:mannose-6-phosphate isomerase-like protein (cupin superfamily)
MTVIRKPWGQEEVIEINDRYMVKKLTMWKGHRCSLQFHNQKQETIYVLSGSVKIYTGTSPHELSEGIYQVHETITLTPGVIHRMEALEDSVYLEASTPEMDDVVRLSDDYNRSVA